MYLELFCPLIVLAARCRVRPQQSLNLGLQNLEYVSWLLPSHSHFWNATAFLFKFITLWHGLLLSVTTADQCHPPSSQSQLCHSLTCLCLEPALLALTYCPQASLASMHLLMKITKVLETKCLTALWGHAPEGPGSYQHQLRPSPAQGEVMP